MAFDLGELVRALRDDPEQRDALRVALFGDQPDLGAALASLTRQVEALAEAQARTEERLEALAQDVRTLAGDLRDLTAAQRRTEDSLKSLVDSVKGMHDRLAKLDGDSLERKYREKGHAYLGPVARRLHGLDGNTLAPMVDDAERAGVFTEAEADSLLRADAIFSGRRRDGAREPVHLVVEASVTIDRSDVRRARERADLLARIVGTPVLAVAAGDLAPSPVMAAAQEADVWVVTNGRTVSPTDDRGDLTY